MERQRLLGLGNKVYQVLQNAKASLLLIASAERALRLVINVPRPRINFPPDTGVALLNGSKQLALAHKNIF
jgi:hypothetical protein